LEYCILAILSREDSYAPKIISELKEAQMIVVEGTLYPILTRLKNAGLLSYRWEESPQGPPRKYYILTEDGRKHLKLLDEAWDEMVAQIQAIRHGGNSASAANSAEEIIEPEVVENPEM
jgi:PadR family transcriptional regulator PadR